MTQLDLVTPADQTKRCSVCREVKPLSEFYYNKTLRCLNSACKPCRGRQNYRLVKAKCDRDPEYRKSRDEGIRDANRKWLLQHPEKRAEYRQLQRKRQAERRGSPPGSCPIHGGGAEWKYSLNLRRWSCQRCVKDGKKARGREKEWLLSMERIRQKHGDRMAIEYGKLRSQLEGRKMVGTERLFRIKQAAFEPICGFKITKEHSKRILLLNRIERRDSLNLGWACRMCGIQHTHWHFFDVDHIFPRSCGGGDSPDNLQILCPNCHRRKTVGITHLPNREWKQPDP